MHLTTGTSYMGLSLPSPIVVSACTLSANLGNIVQMEDCGAGAVVLFSLFEERIKKEFAQINHMHESGIAATEASISYSDSDAYQLSCEQYAELIRQAKSRVDIPVIASLNGTSPAGWIEYSRQLQQAGADAIELNVFFLPTDIHITGTEVEQRYLKIVQLVTDAVSIPVAVKLNPYLSATGWTAKHMANLGAKGLVLFNRLHQPGIDVEHLKLCRDMQFSEPHEMRLPLLWISALHRRIDASLAATTGVHGGSEVIQYLLAGADVVMTASTLYKHGITHLRMLNRQLVDWMERKQFSSIEAFRGLLSQQYITDVPAYTRANYIRALEETEATPER